MAFALHDAQTSNGARFDIKRLPDGYWDTQKRLGLVVAVDKRGMGVPSVRASLTKITGCIVSEDEITTQLSIGRMETAGQSVTNGAAAEKLSGPVIRTAQTAGGQAPYGYWSRNNRLQALVSLSDAGLNDGEIAALVHEFSGYKFSEKRIHDFTAMARRKRLAPLLISSQTRLNGLADTATRDHYRRIFALTDSEKEAVAKRMLAAADKSEQASQSTSTEPVDEATLAATKAKVEAHIPNLRRFARALTKDAVAADDLVQDAVARGIDKIHLWKQGTNLRAWLFAILHNQHVNNVRRLVREGRKVDVDAIGELNLPALTTPEGSTGKLELRDFFRALAQIPEEQSTVVMMIGFEGLRYEAAAEILEVPVGTVRSRLSRGREVLRRLIELQPDEKKENAPVLNGNVLWRERQRNPHTNTNVVTRPATEFHPSQLVVTKPVKLSSAKKRPSRKIAPPGFWPPVRQELLARYENGETAAELSVAYSPGAGIELLPPAIHVQLGIARKERAQLPEGHQMVEKQLADLRL